MTAPARILTIALEEHFQLRVAGRGHVVPERHWDRFPARLPQNVDAALALLARHGATATFFTNDWASRRHAGVLRRIAEAGHEIACALDAPTRTDHDSLAARAAMSRALAESATGRAVTGCRIAPTGDVTGCRQALLKAGFLYECSLTLRRATSPAPVPGGLMRLAVPAWRMAGIDWGRGGAASRRLRPTLLAGNRDVPTVFDLRLWELDPATDHLSVLSRLQTLACYRNLDRVPADLAALLGQTRVVAARDHFGLADEPAPLAAPVVATPPKPAEPPRADASVRLGLSIVIPCFNEEPGLPYLANALATLDQGLGRQHRLSFVLVDDGSRDATFAEMQRLFGHDPRFRLVRHPANRGIGAAVLTGISAAPDDIVAVMDSDCSYDPARLAEMIPLLAPDVALVTASPYHRDGGVEGVPEWRLALSRGASRMYRMVLTNKLATYTSCFRVCRKQALAGLTLRHEGYIGVVEMLARLDLAGWRIVEHPVLLETRFLGRSKLRVLRAVAGHLRFMGEIWLAQLPWRRRGDQLKGVGNK
jgi:hypothetical protein